VIASFKIDLEFLMHRGLIGVVTSSVRYALLRISHRKEEVINIMCNDYSKILPSYGMHHPVAHVSYKGEVINTIVR
jgi:hypothetical protein